MWVRMAIEVSCMCIRHLRYIYYLITDAIAGISFWFLSSYNRFSVWKKYISNELSFWDIYIYWNARIRRFFVNSNWKNAVLRKSTPLQNYFYLCILLTSLQFRKKYLVKSSTQELLSKLAKDLPIKLLARKTAGDISLR